LKKVNQQLHVNLHLRKVNLLLHLHNINSQRKIWNPWNVNNIAASSATQILFVFEEIQYLVKFTTLKSYGILMNIVTHGSFLTILKQHKYLQLLLRLPTS
ncbi:hypothetical protein ACJX0J_023575, partial [Zea mays]